MVNTLDITEEFSTAFPPGIRRFARVIGLSTVIYGFLRLTFVGELISSALGGRRKSLHPLLQRTSQVRRGPILESK